MRYARFGDARTRNQKKFDGALNDHNAPLILMLSRDILTGPFFTKNQYGRIRSAI